MAAVNSSAAATEPSAVKRRAQAKVRIMGVPPVALRSSVGATVEGADREGEAPAEPGAGAARQEPRPPVKTAGAIAVVGEAATFAPHGRSWQLRLRPSQPWRNTTRPRASRP